MRPIDADALLSDRMKTKFYHLPNGDVAIPLIDVEHAPTVGGGINVTEPIEDAGANVFGKWIRLTGMAPPEYHGHKICSVCECFAPYDPIHPWREMLSSYCPGCGAKMEVSEDG